MDNSWAFPESADVASMTVTSSQTRGIEVSPQTTKDNSSSNFQENAQTITTQMAYFVGSAELPQLLGLAVRHERLWHKMAVG
jgi:hypothetical protein